MVDFYAIQLVPIIGATFVGTFVLYAIIKILPHSNTDTSAPLDDSSIYHSARGSNETRRSEGGRKSRKNKRK